VGACMPGVTCSRTPSASPPACRPPPWQPSSDSGATVDAKRITPGMQAPTVAPLSEDGWFGVRSMVPKRVANRVMDDLARLGARAILTTEIRSCRAVDGSVF